MSTNIIQTSFASGELSPTLFARVDLAKYHTGAALMRNFFVDYRGGASTRPGSKYIEIAYQSYFTKDPTKTVRLIPFQFSTIQTYMLEFGDFYMRVIKDGAPVLETAVNIIGITKAAPGVISVAANTYANGDTVYITGVEGMTEINQLTAVVANSSTTTFTLQDPATGLAISTSAFSTYTVGGTVSRVYTLATPYASEDLNQLKFTQSADVMTIVNVNYAPRELTRTGHASWTITAITFATAISAPANLAGTATSAGNASFAYAVTAVDENGEESVASTRADVVSSVAIFSTAGSIALTWDDVTGASSYNIYKANPSAAPAATALPAGAPLGFMGNYTTSDGRDTNITPDFTQTPPLANNPFESDNNPSAVAFFQQRRVFAATTDDPQTMWMSQPGAFKNFDKSDPIKDDDSIEITLASRQVNNIKYMIDMPGGLITLTGGGAWQINGGSADAAITPSSITATSQAYNGSADVEPLVIGPEIIYVQARGTVIRALSYNFYNNIYTGVDISVLSSHFFTNYTLSQWCYSEEPFKAAWAVRDDGNLLNLTYLKEHELVGWSLHETQGLWRSVATIQEGTINATYAVVQRKFGDQYLQYIERFAERNSYPYGVEDCWALDCALTNDLTYPASDLTISANTGTVTFTATNPVFSSGDVGSWIRAGGGIAVITVFTDIRHVIGLLRRDVQDVFQDDTPMPVDEGDWSMDAPTDTFSGFQHLAGQTITVLGDGNVFTDVEVNDSGEFTLSQECTKVIAGIGFTCKLQTLRLDTGEPTIQGKRKNIFALTVRVADSRGLKMGSTFDTVKEYKQRRYEPLGYPIPLSSSDQRINMDPSWNTDGQMCIQQDYPLYTTVLGVIPEIELGDTTK